MKFEFFRHIFEKHSIIKFHENLSSSRSQAVPCARTDRQAYMTKLIVATRKFSKAPKYQSII